MTCTAAAIIAFLGYMPPRGTEIIVPHSALEQYSFVQRAKARTCAARHGIKWRVTQQ